MDTTPSYGFAPFLEQLSADWYADDPLLDQLLRAGVAEPARRRVAEWGRTVAGHLRVLAEESALPANAPTLRHMDAHDRRIDAIELPASTHAALALTAGEARLGFVGDDWAAHYAMIYLLAQNGEAGVACSLACTDGLARALSALGDTALQRGVLDEIRSSSADRVVHGAQFVTEIQGGSDVPANRVRAVADGDAYRLHGQKWFCSNINADWFLVTARPETGAGPAEQVGLFLVPAYGDARPVRNGYTIDRLKDKLGTRELATAEVTFRGALAWPVGPLERGLPNLLRHVLTPSRMACVIFAAAALRQAERVARAYAEFRTAFGRRIADFPLVNRTLDRLAADHAAALRCTFELVRSWERCDAAGYRGDESAHFRILLSLAKPVWTRRATTLLHEAMMVLGGNGIEERFSPLPRLYRDSVIMETWEGPHNVLYTQALSDMLRFDIDPSAFVERVTGQRSRDLADALGAALASARQGQDETTAIADLAPRLLLGPAAPPILR